MKIKLIQELCIACGLCIENAPEIFSIQKNKTQLIKEEIPKQLEQTAKETIEDCPAKAILVL